MIPGKITKFLSERATVAVGGTRSKDLIPNIHRVSGWRVEPDQQTLRCSIPEEFTHNLLSSLEENGQFALTVEHIGTHETYQFKGVYAGCSPPEEADIIAFEQNREQFGKIVSRLHGVSEAASRAYVIKPDIVIRFKVHEIYVQTPGPNAGQRLVPPEEN